MNFLPINENSSKQYFGKRELQDSDFSISFYNNGLKNQLLADQSSDIAEVSSSPDIDPRELQNLEYLVFMVRKIQEAGGIHDGPGMSVLTGEEVAEIAGIYMHYRPSDERIEDVRRQAEALSAAFFDDPRMISAAQTWEESDVDQRKAAIENAFEIVQEILDLPEKVSLDTFSREVTLFNNEYFGKYSPPDWTVHINLHNTAHPTFSEAFSTLFHEALHAVDDYRTRNIPFSQIANEYRMGNITYEDGLTRVSSYLYPDLGLQWPSEDGTAVFVSDPYVYTLIPTEQVAYSGEILLREYLRNGGENVPLKLPTFHPLYEYLQDRELIDSSAAGSAFG